MGAEQAADKAGEQLDDDKQQSSFVFLVIDDRFGVVSASLGLEEAVTDLNKRALAEMHDRTLGNRGSFRLKKLSLLQGAVVRLMQINEQMFEGTVRVLGQQNTSLHEQVSSLVAENAALRQIVQRIDPTNAPI